MRHSSWPSSTPIVDRTSSHLRVKVLALMRFFGEGDPRDFPLHAAEFEDPIPSEVEIRENLSSLEGEASYIRGKFEAIWEDLREKSMKEMSRKTRRLDELRAGNWVYVYIPKLLQKKCGPRWEGPYQVEKVITESGTQLLVRGKVEHALNVKRAFVRSDVGRASDYAPSAPSGASSGANPNHPHKRARIAVAMRAACMDSGNPGGELLLI